MSTYVALTILLLPVLTTSECDLGGTWSTWTLRSSQTGYDYCGSCWRANWIRECLSEPNCPCSGNATVRLLMASAPCPSPRGKCCFDSTVNGKICGNKTEFPPDVPVRGQNYCPPSGTGIWSSWGEWETCSASCGMFGIKKRTRKCQSTGYGCSCCPSKVGECQTMPCPEKPCRGQVCKGNLVTSLDGNGKYCSPFEGDIPTGTWTEWAPAPNYACNSTCNKVSVILSRRVCNPSGSYCPGEFSSYQPCPPDLCPKKRTIINKCPAGRLPIVNFELPPDSFPGAKKGSGSITSSFITCNAELGYRVQLLAVTRGSYGGDKYIGGMIYDISVMGQFQCNNPPTDKIWGDLEFACFLFENDGNETILDDLKTKVSDSLLAKYP